MERKSRLMREVEGKYNQPLERLLPDMYNRLGLPGMAKVLGVSRSTVWYWLMKYGIVSALDQARRERLNLLSETLEGRKVGSAP